MVSSHQSIYWGDSKSRSIIDQRELSRYLNVIPQHIPHQFGKNIYKNGITIKDIQKSRIIKEKNYIIIQSN